jgi:hypothetical protein
MCSVEWTPARVCRKERTKQEGRRGEGSFLACLLPCLLRCLHASLLGCLVPVCVTKKSGTSVLFSMMSEIISSRGLAIFLCFCWLQFPWNAASKLHSVCVFFCHFSWWTQLLGVRARGIAHPGSVKPIWLYSVSRPFHRMHSAFSFVRLCFVRL